MSDLRNEGEGLASSGDSLVEAALAWVERRGLQGPAALLLEMHRPLMPLAWPAAMLLGGLAAPLWGADYWRRIEALRDPALLDRLLRRLEAGR